MGADVKGLELVVERVLAFPHVKACMAFGGFAGVGGMLVLDEWLMGLLIGVLSGTGCALFIKFFERQKLEARVKRFEAGLPFALMGLAVELNLRIPFEKALMDMARENKGIVGREFECVLREVHAEGSSIPEALRRVGERMPSLHVKRVTSLLVNAYEQDSRERPGEALKRLALEELGRQRAEAKEFGGKLSVYALVFIVMSAILPALFQAFVLVGSAFLDLSFTPFQVMAIVVLGFPLMDAGVLAFIHYKTPIFMRGNAF